MNWFTAPIMAAFAVLFAIAFAVQTVRIDGFPLLYPDGLRMKLGACELAQKTANEAATKTADEAREEGRRAAAADADRMAADEAKRKADSDKAISDLQAIVARLQRPQPPVTVRVEGGEPVVITPPVSASCALDRGALDDLRATLNRGRM